MLRLLCVFCAELVAH